MLRELKERFDAKWTPEPYSGCWLWTAAIYPDTGYGVLRKENHNHHAHRISWEIYRGKIPDKLHVLHKCDVRSCVNPDHLFLGTNDDNIRDCIRKDRWCRGERSGSAKLTDSKVLQIRELLKSGLGYKKLGKQFGVHFSAIYKIAKRKRWKHLPC